MAEKQEKVLKKIDHSINSGQHTPLGTKPNDECYTSMHDIIAELSYWAELGKFRGKRIICPCDWDIVADENIYSIEIVYEDNDVEVTGNSVPKVTYGLWDAAESCEKIEMAENEIDDFFRDKLTCNFVRTLTQNARAWGIKSVTASGYNPANGKGIPFQDVDYSQYDICITNPPFSLYGEFMKTIVGKIDFICLAPFLNRVSPNVGLNLMMRKAYLGYNHGIAAMSFNNPTSENRYNSKLIAVDWITSFDDAQKEINAKHYNPGIDYELYKNDYPVMENMTMRDGTHPIRVPGTAWPNYDGWMFTSINVLNDLDQDNYKWYGTSFAKYFNTDHPEMNPFNHKASSKMLIHDGKQMFHGIVFRRKPKEQK